MTEELKQEQTPETAEAVAEETVVEAAEETVAKEAADTAVEETTEEEAVPEEAPEEAPVETMDDYQQELEASFKQIRQGDILKGTVIGVSDTEVTLDLKYYTEGIIRAEDMSADPSFSLKEHIEVGQELSATVLRKDDGQGHILLSGKAAADILAWEKLQKLYEEEAVLDVKVQGVVNAGVIAYVEGIRGFIPASKLSLNYVEDLETWLNKEIQVRIITVEPEGKRLVMSAREILREKAEEDRKNKISNVEVGLVTMGKVETIKPYGAFINIGDGLSGLVHISQISTKRIKSPDVVLNVGDEVKVKIIAVKDGKISLSMKALLEETAEDIVEEKVDIPKAEELTTNLGSLLSKFKLD